MKVYLVYTCKLRTTNVSVESVWQNEEEATKHAEYWDKVWKDWHFWVEEKEVR